MVDKFNFAIKHLSAKRPRSRLLPITVLLAMLLTACTSIDMQRDIATAGNPASPETDDIDSSEPEPPLAERDYPVRPFPTQTFYDLLVAEFAGARGNLQLALENYRRQAHASGDPGVIARAVSTASYQKDTEALQELGLLWVEREPDNLQARNIAFYAHIQQGNFTLAFEQGLYLLGRGNGKYLASLPSYTGNLDSQQSQDLLEQYIVAERTETDKRDILLGKTLLLIQLKHDNEALLTAQRILTLAPEDEAARLITAQLLYKARHREDAINELEQGLIYSPYSEKLQLQLIRFVAEKDLPLAIKKMAQVAAQQTDNDNLKLALAFLHRENNEPSAAREIYQALIAKNRLTSQAHYQLATMAEQDGQPDEALQHYRRVNDGDFFLQASSRLTYIMAQRNQLNDARLYLHRLRQKFPDRASDFYRIETDLLIEHKRHDSAQALLNEGLAVYPGNIDLLYSRSLVNEKLGDIAATEKDLRAIIQQDTNNASALNALGYTLANRTERYDEALELIRKALLIKPNDPAIMDSLGWVFFKRGDYNEALHNLRAAMISMPDPEVAAHLGEVLWVTGAEEEARSIWKKAIDKTPSSELLLDTLQRLNVQL